MIFDENLTTSSATITAKVSTTQGTGKSDVFDFGANSAINIPKGAKIIVTLTNAMGDADSTLKLAYGSELDSGNIKAATRSYSPESYAGADSSTVKTYVFHLDAIRGKTFRYVQIEAVNDEATANAMTAKVVLETPHNSGAVI